MVTLPDETNIPALEIKSLKTEFIEVELPEGLGYKVRVPPVNFTDPEKDAYLRGLHMLLILCPSVLGFPILFFLGRSRCPLFLLCCCKLPSMANEQIDAFRAVEVHRHTLPTCKADLSWTDLPQTSS